MPDEHCRKCGSELKHYSRCSICHKLYQEICLNCNEKTLPKFHYCNVDVWISV